MNAKSGDKTEDKAYQIMSLVLTVAILGIGSVVMLTMTISGIIS